MRKHIYIFSVFILCSLSQSQEACPSPNKASDKVTQFLTAAVSYVLVQGAFVVTDIHTAVNRRLESPARRSPFSLHKPNYEQMRAIQNSRNEYARNVYNVMMSPKNW